MMTLDQAQSEQGRQWLAIGDDIESLIVRANEILVRLQKETGVEAEAVIEIRLIAGASQGVGSAD